MPALLSRSATGCGRERLYMQVQRGECADAAKNAAALGIAAALDQGGRVLGSRSVEAPRSRIIDRGRACRIAAAQTLITA